jgi:hypothetical protein
MRILMLMTALPAMAVCCFGQGMLYFRNDANSLVKAGSEPGALPAGHTLVQLLWSRATGPVIPYDPGSMTPQSWYFAHVGWELFGTPTSIGPEPGRFDGGVLTLPTAVPGAQVLAVVVAWPDQFPTFEWVGNYPYALGVSPSFVIQTGDPTTDPPGTPGSLSGFRGLTIPAIVSVPEPSTMVLIAASVLWMIGRRSQGAL